MTSSCPHCGQALDEHRSKPSATTILPVVPSAAGTEAAPDITAGARSSRAAGAAFGERRTRTVSPVVVAAMVLMAAIVVALVFFRAGDEVASPVDSADGAPVPAPASDRDEEAGVGSGSLGSSGEAADAEPSVSDPLLSDSVAQLFRSEVGDWAVVYPSPMGLQVLSEAGTVQPEVETATGFEEAAQFPLISDGRRSWAVDPTKLDQAYLVSTQFVVIDIDQDGRVAFINDARDPRNIGESSYGAWGPGFDVPADADILAVRERGLFVLPRTGGTFEYVPNGVEAFSDDVLVAASIDSEVFERCDTALVCELYLTTPTRPDPQILEFGARDNLWVSPGGTWLVARTLAGGSLLVSTETGDRLDLAGSVRAVDWSDDGSIAAVLTDDELLMVFPERQEIRSVTLPIAPSASSVLLVPTR